MYIIGTHLKYMPSTATIHSLWTELQAGEFPRGRNYKRMPNMRSSVVLVKVTLKYTLLGRIWSICQVPRRSISCGRSYTQGNSPRDEIKDDTTSPVVMRFWSKWHWHIHYWVASEVNANYRDDPLAVDGATHRGIPPGTKLKMTLQVQFLCVSGQSDIDIYIIGSPLKYMPTTATIHWLWTELQAGEFP
jgi:hypothetical protein